MIMGVRDRRPKPLIRLTAGRGSGRVRRPKGLWMPTDSGLFQEIMVEASAEPSPDCPYRSNSCRLIEEVRRLREKIRRLERMVRVDELTGFFNYRHLREALDVEMERSRRTGLPIALAMIDLDQFKRINDDYGHEAGNRILVAVTKLWRARIRKVDIPCRYGGEEFLVIMPGTRLAAAVRVAERLRKALAETGMDFEKKQETITASFGVDGFEPHERLSSDEFIRRADGFLRAAKEGGRNRVCHDQDRVTAAEASVTAEERGLLLNHR